MNMQGSFWQAFGVRFGRSTSAIDEILEKESFTLEELLDHDDVIQECKYMNAALIEYLSQKKVVEKLIQYVIATPPEEMNKDGADANKDATEVSNEHAGENGITSETDKSESQSENGQSSKDEKEEAQPSDKFNQGERAKAPDFKYPYIASELFACEVVSMLEVLFEDDCSLLDLLFSFLDNKPNLDPGQVSYFRKVVVVLIQRKYDQLVKYIQSHNIIEKMVNHIGLYSIMELLIMIGWDDGMGQMNDVEWLYKENLIPKLVAKLAPQYEVQPDVHINAARALVDVVVKCPPSQKNLLVSHLQSPPILVQIFDHMFSDSLSSLTNAMSIIIVLVQRYANRKAELQQMGQMGPDQTEENVDFGLEEPFATLMPYLPRILDLLSSSSPSASSPHTEMKTQFGCLSPPFGETRMKCVELFLVLFRSRYKQIDEELVRLKVLPRLLEVFFAFAWNNMLHGLVESIIRSVLESDSVLLKKALFHDAKLVDKFKEAHQRNDDICAKPNGYRQGYMGHLIRTANCIKELLSKDAQLRELLGDQTDPWNDYVNTLLQKDNERQGIILGGHRPSSPFNNQQQGQEEDLLDGLQFDLNTMASSYLGSKDGDDDNDNEYNYQDQDEEEGGHGGMDYDYNAHINNEEESWNNDNINASEFQSEWSDFATDFQSAQNNGNKTNSPTGHNENEFGDFGRSNAYRVGQSGDDVDDDDVVTVSNPLHPQHTSPNNASGTAQGNLTSFSSPNPFDEEFDPHAASSSSSSFANANSSSFDDFHASFPGSSSSSSASSSASVADVTQSLDNLGINNSSSSSSSSASQSSASDDFAADFPPPN